MKKLHFLLLAMFLPCAGFAEVVHLNCEGRDVVVDFLDDGALITVDGSRYAFIQEYDARAAYYNADPWMRLEIGRRDQPTKYAFGEIVNDIATYKPCQELN